MTPEMCVALAAFLLELRDWIMETRPGSLDVVLVEAVVDLLTDVRAALVKEGAK